MSYSTNQFSSGPHGPITLSRGREMPSDRLDLEETEPRQRVRFADQRAGGPTPDQCLHQLFEAQAARTPDAPALAFEGNTLTYRELNTRANQLAWHLRSAGVRPDVLVGLCVDRSIEMIVGLLAILKAGGAYLPLDPAYPPGRLGFMLEDAQTPLVLTQRKLVSALPASQAKIIFLDDPPPAVGHQSTANPENQSSPDSLAYVIFTSGSTGRPKGVLITHFNVVRLMQATETWFHFNEDDVWTMFHSFAFDFSVWEIWGALLYGGKLVVVPYFVSRSPRDFYELLAAEKVTVLNQTPTAFRQLIQAEAEAIPARELALRQVIFGGEALVMSSLQPWFERHGDEHPRLVNMYGITETTVHVTYRPLKKADVFGPSVIGAPIPDLQLHILDEHGRPAPAGVPGELFVGGAGLARGYLHRPELTAERFLLHLPDSQSQTRLYRTGDLARRLPGGDIEYLGRIDSQIKIRGHRIELGEIETVLRGHPEIADCVTVARDGGGGDQQLVAHIVCRGNAAPAAASLRQWLGEKLPGYMIPARFVVIPEVPLTPNGKADRKALRDADLAVEELVSATDFVAPRNELERALAEIWQAVLQRERVGIHDNFFSLGGHSLLAILICSRINGRLGMTVPLRWVFEHPTIEALASQAASLASRGQATATVEKADRRQPLPMSFGQQQMWLVHQALPDAATYNEYVTCRLAGPVDPQRVRQALLRIMERHEVLRTALRQEGYELVQQISAAGTVALPWQEMELAAPSVAEREAALVERLMAWARAPFDLARAPLWRALWIGLGPAEQVLAVAFHHSIVDEWSLRLFFEELERLYAAPANSAVDLPVLPVQYADFAVWQRKQLTGAYLEQQRYFWRERLRDLPPPLELPADQARPRQPSGRGKSHHFQVPIPVVAGLRELARQEGATLFTVALAAFQAWLYRLTGQADVIVGTPIANRDRPETQHLLGYFLNTLPLRARVDASADFKTLLQQVRARVLSAFDHAQLPFEQMVELAIRERTFGAHPLYQVMFVLLETGVPPLRLGVAEGRVLSAETGTSKNDLVLNIQAHDAIWDCRLDYAVDLFADERAAGMARNLKEMLQSIAESPTLPIGQLSQRPDRQRQPNPPAANVTARECPRGKCAHQLFEEQAERTPEAVAVVFEQQSLTYRELNLRANQLATHLRSLEVGPDSAVGLCVERSLEMVIGLLGILKAGGGYVPFDPALPSQRLAAMIDNAACTVMLTRHSLLPVLNLPVRAPKTPLVLLDAIPDPGPLNSGENPAPLASPHHLAYVMYTSGSTGQPKGVEMPHRALVNLLHWQCSLSARGPGSRTLQFASLGFDVSFQEIFSTWATGGTLVLVNEERRKDPTALLAIIKEERIERLFLPFVMLEQLAEAAGNQDSLLDHLQEISVAGEQLRIGPAIRRFFSRLPGCRLWNHYGPVEAHVVTSHELSGPADLWPDLPPIGRPIPNCQIYLLDSQLNTVGPGAVGDLFIGGDCLARGYRNRPDLTAERFLSHPAEPGACLYRTGDLARWRPDGSLEFLGRADHQVKIRGFRVEPGEIEAVLAEHPAVSGCAVVAHNLGRGDKQLVAHVVRRNGVIPAAEALQQWLREKLPDYMIPARFMVAPELPLSPNGKVDRKALMELDWADEKMDPSRDFVAPRNDLERTLVEIWQVVLHREQVGIHDNFFNLGGHSLLAAVMCSHIHRQLGLAVALRSVFEHPTIAALANHAVSRNGMASATAVMEKANRQRPLPMSFGQQQMWILHQTVPDPAAFNESVACHLAGPVDQQRVRQALLQIMERHEVLRTALRQHGQDMVQEISAAGTVALPWQEMDLAAPPLAEREAVLAERLMAWAHAPFDLARAPLWRALWIGLGPAEQVLAVTFHHSIADEWSLRLFFHELEQLYAAPANAASNLPVLPVQYADFAVWQRQQLTGACLEQQRHFWREQLRDLPPPLELPADQARPRQPSGCGEAHHFPIPGPIVAGLRELGRQEGATLFTVVLAAFQVWLYRLTGQADVIVGTPVANRERPEVQHLLGFFLNGLPIRTRVDATADFQTILRLVWSTVLNSFDHSALPFEEIVKTVIQECGAEPPSLHQVMFVFLEEGLPPLHFDKASGRLEAVTTKTTKCDLLLHIFAANRDWNCRIEYATDLFTSECAARLAGHLTELLRSIVEHPHQPVSQLNLLDAAERRRILFDWNQTERAYPRDQGIGQLFAEQAERTPEAVAVVFGECVLTYRELRARASHLAQHLRALGVGPQVIVGLRVERSPEMVVALLGILEAGGAYWAVEENLPEDRLRMLLAAARPRVLLVRQNSKTNWAMLAEHTPDSPRAAPILAVLEDLLTSPAPPNVPALCPSQPGDPAYVSYTSGSTGRPKGVVVPHRGVARLVKGTDYVSLTEKEVLLHLSPLSFDASTFELWGALLNGGRVILMPPGPPALSEIAAAIRRHGVTTAWLTAGLFHLMVEEHLDDLKPLRQLLAGGDVLSPEHVRKARRGLPHCRIINGYGPTENTTFTCCHTVREERDLSPSVPIGGPIANTRVYVLDSFQQPVPVGVRGELYAGGDGVACGYLHQPELTAERFLPDPYSEQPGARLYRTGDQVRWRPDGTLEFLGRMDSQVKIRGFRVELGEIENVLLGQPNVREAVVVAREGFSGDKRLTAYLVPRVPTQPDNLALQAALAEKLPVYMVPDSLVWLDKIPLTANGKVDRQALPVPDARETQESVGQRTDVLEWELSRIWRKLFQRENIGRQDNFFALGGHSLLATRLAAEVEKALGASLPVSAVFQSPTIESLARRFADENWSVQWSSLVPLHPTGTQPPLYILHGIEGDLFRFVELAQLLGPDQPVYGIQAVGLDGKSPRHASIEEMAAHYVSEIVSFQTEGPFYLAGYSLGGLIAFEVARQLHLRGRRVALLALLDCAPVGPTPWRFHALSLATYFAGDVRFHWQRWSKLPGHEKIGYLLARLESIPRAITGKRRKATAGTTTTPPETPSQSDYYEKTALAHRLQPYPGRADFFVSDEGVYGLRWTIYGWRWYWQYLVRGGVSFHRVPGLHLEIFSADKLPALANALARVLRRRQKENEPPAVPQPPVGPAKE